ncbi:MAG: hypothetical protein AAB774_00710 [Patescibacteria group bacterium]
MSAFGYIVLATLFYSGFQLFVSRTAGKIDATLPGVIGNFVAVVIPLGVFLYLRFVKRAELFPTTTSGVIFSVLAGVAVAIYGIFLVKAFERADTAFVIPLVFGGSILLSTLISWVVFKEHASTQSVLGTLLIVSGIILISLVKR